MICQIEVKDAVLESLLEPDETLDVMKWMSLISFRFSYIISN